MTLPRADLSVNPAEEPIHVGPLEVRFLVTADNSAGSLLAFELAVPGARELTAPAHNHDRYEETICGIAGVLTWTVDAKSMDVAPGQALRIPRGAVHGACLPPEPAAGPPVASHFAA